MSDYLAEKIDLDGVAAKLLTRAGWINLKPLLGKTFRLFGNQKVPDMGVIGGKIQVLFLWKLGSWPWRFDGFDKLTPKSHRRSPYPVPTKNFFSKP